MPTHELFGQALGLQAPWAATEVRFDVAKTIKRHWAGVHGFIRSRITNGSIDGLNSKIKTALKRAYGFKTFENYGTIIYLIAGKLDLPIRCCRELELVSPELNG